MIKIGEVDMMQQIKDIPEYMPEMEQVSTCSYCLAQFPRDLAFQELHMKVAHGLIV